MTQAEPTVGILAYGSLIDDPGDELGPVTTRVIRDVVTPFAVEYARTSRSRGGAATLVPYAAGASVRAAIMVLEVSACLATDMLWRRETRQQDQTLSYPGARLGNSNAVRVQRLQDFAGIDIVLYTAIDANITPLTPDHLARLAVASVGNADAGKDGISYLIAAMANGIITPLSSAYQAAILHCTGAETLIAALATLYIESSKSEV